MRAPTKPEMIAAVIILVLLALVAVEELRKHDANLKAEIQAHADQQQIKAVNDALAAREVQYQKAVAPIIAAQKALPTMSNAQIVSKTAQYVPAAQKPIVIVGPDTQPAKLGDAIVPQEDIKPIAAALLDGEKCKVDLTKCVGDRDDWQRKYDLADDEAKQWQKAAKGGSPLMRALKCAGVRGGVGAGVGAAFGEKNRGQAAIFGFGTGAVTCFFIKE